MVSTSHSNSVTTQYARSIHPSFGFKKATSHIKIRMHCNYLLYSEPPERAEKYSSTILVRFDFPTLRNCYRIQSPDLQLWCIRSAASSETVPGQAGVADLRRPLMESPNLREATHGPHPKKNKTYIIHYPLVNIQKTMERSNIL